MLVGRLLCGWQHILRYVLPPPTDGRPARQHRYNFLIYNNSVITCNLPFYFLEIKLLHGAPEGSSEQGSTF